MAAAKNGTEFTGRDGDPSSSWKVLWHSHVLSQLFEFLVEVESPPESPTPAPLLCPWDLCARADVLQRRDRKVLLLSRFLMDFHRWVKLQRDSHLSAYQTCILSARYPQHCH